MKLFCTLIFSVSLSAFAAYGSEVNYNPQPTDSSASVVNKIAATYLIDEGKKILNEGRFRDALQRFREAYVRDQYNYRTAYWIGEAHYALDNYGYALRYGKIAESLSKASDGDVFFLLAKSYHRQGVLDSARMNYKMAEAQLPVAKKNAYELRQKINEIEYAISVESEEMLYERVLMNENINSGYDDYGAMLSPDGKELYYTSRRPDTRGGNINPGDQRYFEDIYLTKWDEETKNWGTATNDIERLNSEGFDAASYISPDGNTVYMTVNTSVLDIRRTTRSSDICVAERTKEGRWSLPRAINNKSINTTFFDGAPTLTADGNTMYFVSDRDGIRTKSDIYVVHKDGNKWGTAKKLPALINTVGNETTPYITPDGRYLFFSSDGHKGM
ncbi:MAG TPA: hypothetical protein VKX31_09020, partial [Brumimicrobium sp.]|nr:hypothetical protein [Brumimicrobium sp.]